MFKRINNNKKMIKRALIIATCVGPTLTIINQWDAIFGGAQINFIQFLLTMIVPFVVSLTSSYLMAAEQVKVQNHVLANTDLANPDLASTDLANAVEQYELATQTEPPAPEITVTQSEMPDSQPSAMVEDNEPTKINVHSLEMAGEKVEEILGNAQKVNLSSLERVQFISELISRAENVRSSFEDISEQSISSQSSIEDINSGISQISVGVEDLSNRITVSVDHLEQMTGVVENFQSNFSSMQMACDRIDELSSAIKMVSLNATIEASRVGEAGKGFALIAKEVRELSERSATDLAVIQKEIGAQEKSLNSLTTEIQNIRGEMLENRKSSEQFMTSSLSLCQESRQLSELILNASTATSSQLPAVSELVSSIQQIKENTQAAVIGSEKNMNLCKQTLSDLGDVSTTIPLQKSA